MNAQLSGQQREFLMLATQAMREASRRKRQDRWARLYPDEDTVQDDGSIIYARAKYPKHMEFFEAGATYRERCAMAANRVGKALRNGTPVATPTGWKPIEALQPGDEVIAGDGTTTVVTGVFPQGIKPLFRLTFDGAHEIDCCAEHLWVHQWPRARYPYRQSHGQRETNPFYGDWSVSTTEEILKRVGAEPISRQRVVMPGSHPWQLEAQALPLDPYLLGALLGDGMMGAEALTVSTADPEIVEAVRRALPDGCTVRHLGRHDHRINKGKGRRHPVMTELRSLGLHGLKSHEKFVPQSYLLGSVPQRLAVLQGLMDTDGSITKTGAMEFSSTSRRLVDDVVFLVVSLGGRATIEARQTHCNGKPGLPSWRARIRLNLCPFRLPRKAARWNQRKNTSDRVLHRIEEAEPGHATCISVAHPDRTYVTAHGVVTHNTFGMGGYEIVPHLTGVYPAWWKGRRFTRGIKAWVAGKTNETTRDILQFELLGELLKSADGRRGFDGTGLIPGTSIGGLTFKKGGSDLVDVVKIRHASGGWSRLGFKSFEQGRGAFEGTAQHVIWLDEEPPIDIYGECVIRTATTNGIVMLTFTPLDGISETVMQFMEGMDQDSEE